ncbi:MAG: response regulator transcription factor, partial [Kiritimatiellae bacterium]|nr:response regulator transcription factor [Kiritimatiellia bacterium]
PVPILTERQQYIVSYIARGLTNNDIAEALGISPTVVREHITTILAKVGAANRAEAVAIALRKHLVKL